MLQNIHIFISISFTLLTECYSVDNIKKNEICETRGIVRRDEICKLSFGWVTRGEGLL
jgi:hypothetical protein